MQAAYDRIIPWIDSLTPPGCIVIVANQNAPTPEPPFVTVKIDTAMDVARDYANGVRDAGDQGLSFWQGWWLAELKANPLGSWRDDLSLKDAGPFPNPEPDFVRDVVRFMRLTVNLQVYGQRNEPLSAEAIAQQILDGAYDHDNALDFLGRSLAFQLVLNPPQSIDGVIGAEFEPRVVMALQFGITRNLLYKPGVIDRAIIDGQAGAQTTRSDTGNEH